MGFFSKTQSSEYLILRRRQISMRAIRSCNGRICFHPKLGYSPTDGEASARSPGLPLAQPDVDEFPRWSSACEPSSSMTPPLCVVADSPLAVSKEVQAVFGQAGAAGGCLWRSGRDVMTLERPVNVLSQSWLKKVGGCPSIVTK